MVTLSQEEHEDLAGQEAVATSETDKARTVRQDNRVVSVLESKQTFNEK